MSYWTKKWINEWQRRLVDIFGSDRLEIITLYNHICALYWQVGHGSGFLSLLKFFHNSENTEHWKNHRILKIWIIQAFLLRCLVSNALFAELALPLRLQVSVST